MSNIFEKASRLQLRYNTEKGQLDVEDLWDLPLTRSIVSLDNIAKDLNRSIKQNEEESFVVEKSSEDDVLELMFEIVKHIIKIKLEERDAEKKRVENKQKKQRIIEIMTNKEDEALMSKSTEELSELLETL